MFERFTNKARHVVVRAQEEARGLKHNYIGTEHILLALLDVRDGLAAHALERFEMTPDSVREEVKARVGIGTTTMTGHIPFTPRAKKTLELALREALELHHNYIGTEHMLLGVIREGEGVGAQLLREHSADLEAIRMAVLDLLSSAGSGRSRRSLRRLAAARASGASDPDEPAEMPTTPAAETSLGEAARLAGQQPVGSHHLLLAVLADPDTAAARALVALGLDVEQAKEALRTVDVTGTSDEPPEEAGRRQMIIRVTDERLTLEAADPVIVKAGQAALQALGDQAQDGAVRGDLPVTTSLSTVWQALRDSLDAIQRRAAASVPETKDGPDQPENETA